MMSEKYLGSRHRSPNTDQSVGERASSSFTTRSTARRFVRGSALPRTAISLRHSQDASTRTSNASSHSRSNRYSTNVARDSRATASASTI